MDTIEAALEAFVEGEPLSDYKVRVISPHLPTSPHISPDLLPSPQPSALLLSHRVTPPRSPLSDYKTDDGHTLDALKRVCIGTLPHTLIVVFKRFVFDYDTMIKGKLFDTCTFPDVLDVSPYVSDSALAANGHAPTLYRLVGATIHIGDGEFGHYYSYAHERVAGRAAVAERVQGRDAVANAPPSRSPAGNATHTGGRWIEFNDSSIREVSREELLAAGIGRDESANNSAREPPARGSKQSMATPYILFYERIEPPTDDAAAPSAGAEMPSAEMPEMPSAAATVGGAADGAARAVDGAARAADAADAADAPDAPDAPLEMGGAWAIQAALDENASIDRQASVFSAGHVRFVERLLVEQAEAWRVREISMADAAHALVHGVEFVAGTLCHAPEGLAAGPLAGVQQALCTLCADCPPACHHLLGHLAHDDRRDALLRGPLLECPFERLSAQYAAVIIHTLRCAANDAASAPRSPNGGATASGGGDGERFHDVLDATAALLSLLVEAADMIRRGGTPSEGAHSYLQLLAALDADPLLASCMRAAAPPATRRLLELFLPDPSEQQQPSGNRAGGQRTSGSAYDSPRSSPDARYHHGRGDDDYDAVASPSRQHHLHYEGLGSPSREAMMAQHSPSSSSASGGAHGSGYGGAYGGGYGGAYGGAYGAAYGGAYGSPGRSVDQMARFGARSSGVDGVDAENEEHGDAGAGDDAEEDRVWRRLLGTGSPAASPGGHGAADGTGVNHLQGFGGGGLRTD